MNIAYIVSILVVLLLLVTGILSFIKSSDLKIQLLYIVVASFAVGVFTSIILFNLQTKSTLIWPGLILVHVITKIREFYKHLS